MLSFLLFSSSLLNFAFYIYAIGFVIALVLEQVVKNSDNERNIYIVESNRKYLWRQTWIININWFVCNIGLYILSRNMQSVGVDHFWDGI
jgi:preprotein translocase subunit SecG